MFVFFPFLFLSREGKSQALSTRHKLINLILQIGYPIWTEGIYWTEGMPNLY